MIHAIAGRVRRLEQAQGDCPLCDGKGKVVLETNNEHLCRLHGGDPSAENQQGCPRCGRKMVILVKYVKETMIRR
jgi:hypothetical protein